jgi:hypothetical protein
MTHLPEGEPFVGVVYLEIVVRPKNAFIPVPMGGGIHNTCNLAGHFAGATCMATQHTTPMPLKK